MTNIRLLNRSDEPQIVHLLNRETSFNGLIKSDLKRTDSASVTMYGSFSSDVLTGVVFIFTDKIVYYGLDDTEVMPLVPCISSSHIKKIAGKASLIERFIPFLDVESVSESSILELNAEPQIFDHAHVKVCKLNTAGGFRRLHNLFCQVQEYSSVDPNVGYWVQGQLRAVVSGTMRAVYAEVDGEMVSTAASIGETAETAILAGVATLPQFRNSGYASVLVSALSREMIREGKTIYLFHNNPSAGSIYKRLGFREGGAWKVLQLH